MSNWTYNTWRSQVGDAARHAMLLLHIEEVSGTIGGNTSAEGFSQSSETTLTYLNGLTEEARKLEGILGISQSGSGKSSNFRPVRSR